MQVRHLSRSIIKLLFISIFLKIITSIEVISSLFNQQCYPDIGCFPLTQEFYHPRHRPWNVHPWPRSLINTKFEFFNRNHPEGYMLTPWDKLNLVNSHFNPNYETKIIIPGWLDNIRRAVWIRKMVNALTWLWKPCNIIVLHWTNFTPYTIATANTRIVGAELANLIKFIEAELNYNRTYYHLIGHSLGAHISGYAGNRLPGLGRITALDPARPFFQHMPKSIRLDRGDAKFVDAIHSDFNPENAVFLLMSFGMTTPVGHLDFYPNGPPILQPGCLKDSLLSLTDGINKGFVTNSLPTAFLEAVRYLSACDHQRAYEYFIESITNRHCAFVGVRCNSFEGLVNGRCTCDQSQGTCALMGLQANQIYLSELHEELWPAYQAGRWRHHRDNMHRKSSVRKNPLEILIGEPREMLQEERNFIEETTRLVEPVIEEEELESLIDDDAFFEYLKLGLLKKRDNFKRQDDLGLSGFLTQESEEDIEKWYEENSRWFLKTSRDSRSFCVNQYQVLVYLGSMQSSRGLEHIRANFVLTIIGTKGRIAAQRFRPNLPNLEPFTMQPFFILIDGSYSLGDIVSVAIAWEQRLEPSPIQATISFESKILEAVEPMLLSYNAKHPLFSSSLKDDFSKAFAFNNLISPPPLNTRRLSFNLTNQTSQEAAHSAERRIGGEAKFNANFHNIGLHQRAREDLISIRRVIVSPIKPRYGKEGALKKVGRTFCPPTRDFLLERERTLRLQLSPLPGDQECHYSRM